ncbi:MAG: transketolase C-terminal domain-containing protein [Angelakisella sp.]|nr:transketolase C-terminal domain-containing protein [Angelakisella sp.]
MANKEMRAVLAEKLEELMLTNDKIVVVDADLAKANGTWGLRQKFPQRALDVGICEQNMTSFAAGLASYGFIPFIGSFTAFATRRTCDQLAISVCYAKQNVKIIGSDPGISAELNGGTHMSFEDIAVLRSLPGMVIFEPVDAVQLEQSLPQIVDYNGPVYIRLFRKPLERVMPEGYTFDLFQADVLREGTDVSIFATGLMVQEAVKAVELLAAEGISAELVNVHTIKPLDKETILTSVRKTGCAVTAENHNVVGGLKSAVAELLSEEYPVPMKAIGVQDHFGEVAKMDYLMKKYKMTAQDIAEAAKTAIKSKKG